MKQRSEWFGCWEIVGVPPDNNPGERDIRSVTAARADGGVNRTKAGATAFANLKSLVRTCQKHGRNFLSYGLSLVGLDEQFRPFPFPTRAAIPESPLANTSSLNLPPKPIALVQNRSHHHRTAQSAPTAG